jgi:hypothetical protein
MDITREPEIISDKTFLKYIHTLIGTIERRKISSEEILALIRRVLREHSIVKKRKRYYFGKKGAT